VQVNGRQRLPASGFVYAGEMVLTADHVLEREDDLTIQAHDGQTHKARFAGRDPATDLAVLQVAGLGAEPAQAAAEPARVGQLVLAVGRPGSEGPMASVGIVSAVGGPLRAGRGGMLERYIRTDATPYPGFSGGPLIDVNGAVLGLLTTGLAGGATLAIPADLAWRTAELLSRQGFVKRGYLGISTQPVPLPANLRAGRQQQGGLLIVRVQEGSPAEQGGLLLGDVVVTLDGQPVTDPDGLQSLLTGDRVDRQVPVEVIRAGAFHTVPLTVGQRS
jgi:S1-C subfamily serine protease